MEVDGVVVVEVAVEPVAGLAKVGGKGGEVVEVDLAVEVCIGGEESIGGEYDFTTSTRCHIVDI